MIAQDGQGICRASRRIQATGEIADRIEAVVKAQIVEATNPAWAVDQYLELMRELSDEMPSEIYDVLMDEHLKHSP